MQNPFPGREDSLLQASPSLVNILFQFIVLFTPANLFYIRCMSAVGGRAYARFPHPAAVCFLSTSGETYPLWFARCFLA
jgi:hypothetical protein